MQDRYQGNPRSYRLSRRDILLQIGRTGLWSVLAGPRMSGMLAQEKPNAQAAQSPAGLSPADDQFLDELQKQNFQFFWEQAGAQTGLVRDRANVSGNENSVVASIAATGFGLTALCIAEKRGYV